VNRWGSLQIEAANSTNFNDFPQSLSFKSLLKTLKFRELCAADTFQVPPVVFKDLWRHLVTSLRKMEVSFAGILVLVFVEIPAVCSHKFDVRIQIGNFLC
jgi:hypothetical protein